eukprot:CAMPEP_0117058942 /NCGR_PEP_ID=MMETSP0472-20121206/40931_1 /TAXON_ID=693140 ORGANISM="Tiarina fusus, Strain LIS" /NCGR_SAMPLE_ID=MMETSP0472 /ASSEMBLY_ACC=CAM_ASM_000603 /LENGTH=276 /DNA_ID=CAMNT_0004776433 /DNA_START=322 /DNA_END=1148 /DNA_ORIENTATION=-
MGQEAAESTIVERSLLSIRRRGMFMGPVIVLSDAPAARYHNLAVKDPNFIPMRPLSQDWRRNLTEDMPYKRFKTYILQYLELDDRLKSVELVYYLDIDVVVGRPMKEWFEHVESTFVPESRKYSSSLIFFKGNFPWRPLQGGQFLVQRKFSQVCLERWRHHIDAHPEDPKDQSANNATQPHTCHLVIMPQYPYLQFINETVIKDLVRTQKYPTLMHIKNTEHADWIPDRLQRRFFQKLLMLNSREAKLVGKTQIHPSQQLPSASQLLTTKVTATKS